jgi:hypothetical protein
MPMMAGRRARLLLVPARVTARFRAWRRIPLHALEIGAKVRCVLITQLAILLERLADDLVEPLWEIVPKLPWGRRLFMENGGSGDGARRSGECRLIRRHLVQHRTEREQIGPAIERLSAQLFRRHVRDGADRATRLGERRRHGLGDLRRCILRDVSRRFRETEIENLRSVRRQEDVARFDVAVDDAGLVRGVDRVGEHDGSVEECWNVEAAAGETMLEGFALQQFHDEKALVACVQIADVVHRADVRMLQRGDGASFAAEALARLRRSGEIS